jgi:hypothetical protein
MGCQEPGTTRSILRLLLPSDSHLWHSPESATPAKSSVTSPCTLAASPAPASAAPLAPHRCRPLVDDLPSWSTSCGESLPFPLPQMDSPTTGPTLGPLPHLPALSVRRIDGSAVTEQPWGKPPFPLPYFSSYLGHQLVWLGQFQSGRLDVVQRNSVLSLFGRELFESNSMYLKPHEINNYESFVNSRIIHI